MTEPQFTRKICNELTNLGVLIIPIVGTIMQKAGLPDRYIHSSLFRGFLEFKSAIGRLSEIQKYQLQQLNLRCPGTAFVIRMPNKIEASNGTVLAIFTDGRDLLVKLAGLQNAKIVSGS